MMFGPFALLWFYFWYRRRLIDRAQYVAQVWTLSFRAGFVSYIVFLVLLGVAAFVEGLQEERDNRIYLTQFQTQLSELKQEEKQLIDNLVLYPEKEQDIKQAIKNNVYVLEAYFQHIQKKKELYKKWAPSVPM